MPLISKRLDFFSSPNLIERLDRSLKPFRQLEDTEKTNAKPRSSEQIHRQSRQQNIISIAAFVLAVIAVTAIFYPAYNESDSIKSKHLIEYLSGGEKGSWKSWRIVEGVPLSVSIINQAGMDDRRISVIIDAIQSQQVLEENNGQTSQIMYLGWAGALEEANNSKTIYNIPTQFDIVNAIRDEGDIVIILSDLKDDDGFTGYTRSLVAEHEILKSYITIYNVHNLSDKQLSTIVKHEFGHALGLGHSTNPQSLMHDKIKTDHPFITSCNIDGLVSIYNGKQADESC